MTLLVRRPSDWSVVLRTPQGQQISYDRSNRRITTAHRAPSRRPSIEQQARSRSADNICPLCQQPLRQEEYGADGQEAGFVHPEYFGYLAACLEQEEGIIDDLEGFTSNPDAIQPSAFNDGYLARFFHLEGLLGRGGRGEVSKVRHVLEGCDLGTFALKRCSVGDSHTWLTKMLREVQNLKFQHENLIRYNHVWLEHAQLTLQGPRVPVLHILQEYCNGGDLEAFVLKQCGKVEPTVEERKARRRRQSRGAMHDEAEGMTMETTFSIFKDLVTGLAVLHEQGVLHRDLKPSNCLLDFRSDERGQLPRALVSDFGEAQFGLSSNVEARQGGTGTLLYTAPEIVRGEAWTPAADVFSLGMILHFMTHAGKLPYQTPEQDFERLRGEIASYVGYEGDASGASRELGMLLSRMLAPVAASRPSCGDLLALVQATQRPWASASLGTAGASLRRLSTLLTRGPTTQPVLPDGDTVPEKTLALPAPMPTVKAYSILDVVTPILMPISLLLVDRLCRPNAVATTAFFGVCALNGALVLRARLPRSPIIMMLILGLLALLSWSSPTLLCRA